MELTKILKSTSSKQTSIPVREISIYIFTYTVRIFIFAAIYLASFHKHIENKETLRTRVAVVGNNMMIGCIASHLVLYTVLYSILTYNTYGYYLSAGMMMHSFILSLTVLGLEHSQVGGEFWVLRVGIVLSYVVDFSITCFFIKRRQIESRLALFRTIGADPTVNMMYSVREKLKTLGPINMIIPTVMFQKLYLPPPEHEESFEHIGCFIFVLTIFQQILVYTQPDNENMMQRKAALAVTGIKIAATVILLIFSFINYRDIARESIIVRIILYVDLLMISIIFLYYLLMDTRSYGSRLKSRVEKNCRLLVLHDK